MAAELKDHLYKELQSFKTPPAKQVAPLPKLGDPAPKHEKLQLPQDKPAIILFLRHCGCPCEPVTFSFPPSSSLHFSQNYTDYSPNSCHHHTD